MQDEIDRLLSRKPLLKAREIAKELGLERKEVSAFLHAHPDRYRQDSEYRWSVAEEEELTVTLPQGWLTGGDLEAQLRNAGPVLTGPARRIKIVFSPKCKTMIDCIARLLALINQLIHRGKSVTVDFTNAEPTRKYLDRAGFFDNLHDDAEILPERPTHSAARRYRGQSDTLVEFGAVDPSSPNEELIEQLTNTFVQQSTADYRVAAFTVFGELIGNVVEHSGTPIPGFAGPQKYSGHKTHIQTVVSDSGLGIAGTLRPALEEHYPSLHKLFGDGSIDSNMGLVIAAMSKGEVSRFGGARGLGFKSSREQAAVRFNASFSVRQENFGLRFEYREGELVQIQKQKQLSRLLGTHICFDFYVD
jgi:hypothetical protein